MSLTKRGIALALTLLFVVSSSVVLGAPQQQTSQQQESAPVDSRSESRALTALYDSVQVDISCGTSACTGSTIATASQTRKLVVSSTGVIFALFWNPSGIWVAKSTNRGATFAAPTRVTTTAFDGEMSISADGTLYVIWRESGGLGSYQISKSTNAGTTWGAPITISTGWVGSPMEMAVDGDYLYAIPDYPGWIVHVSSDAGATWTEKTIGTGGSLSASIYIDPLTHAIYVFRFVFRSGYKYEWQTSADRGTTWSAEKFSTDVPYFIGALTNNGTNKYVYLAGRDSNLERLNLTDETFDTKIVVATDTNTRSLAADSCGNVISGNKTGSDLYLQYSTNSGSTFSIAELVEAGADRSSASINYTNGDVLYLYEKSGHVYLSTYAGLLGGAGSCYALNISRTAVEFAYPGEEQVITLKNTSTSPMTVSSITLNGTAFTKATTCKATISAGRSCTVTISGNTVASELLTVVIGGITKIIPVNLGVIAGSRLNPFLMKKGAVGASFVLGLLQNKTLVSWGMNREFQASIPPCCGSDIDDIAVGTNFALALKGGKVYGWGANTLKQITIPATASKDIVSIAAGGSHGMALTNKGLVVAWGNAGHKQTTIPNGLKGVVSIAAGNAHSLALRSDGKVVAWGANESGQTKVPVGLKTVVQVAGGLNHTVTLKSDGTVVAWGGNAKGQSAVPRNAKDIKQISAGNQFSLAVRNDGSVFGWGSNDYNQLFIPTEYTNIANAYAGYSNTILGLRNGRIIVLGDQSNGVNASRTPTKSAPPTP
jgi:hypothetical protein